MLVLFESVFAQFESLLQGEVLLRVLFLLFTQLLDVVKHLHPLHGALAEHEVVISNEVHHQGFFLVSPCLRFGVACFQ